MIESMSVKREEYTGTSHLFNKAINKIMKREAIYTLSLSFTFCYVEIAINVCFLVMIQKLLGCMWFETKHV